jgi:hypothetical protein
MKKRREQFEDASSIAVETVLFVSISIRNLIDKHE